MLDEVLPRIFGEGAAFAPSTGPSREPDVPSPREPAFKRAASSSPDTLKEFSTREDPVEALFCQAAMEDCRKSNPHATEVEPGSCKNACRRNSP